MAARPWRGGSFLVAIIASRRLGPRWIALYVRRSHTSDPSMNRALAVTLTDRSKDLGWRVLVTARRARERVPFGERPRRGGPPAAWREAHTTRGSPVV